MSSYHQRQAALRRLDRFELREASIIVHPKLALWSDHRQLAPLAALIIILSFRRNTAE